jgi:hypothetical protein
MNIVDYQIIARAIASSAVPTTTKFYEARVSERRILVEQLAKHLAENDVRFDRQWFMRACGVAAG